MLTVPQPILTVHQHRYSIPHHHCSSASTITPSLDCPQTSITGPSLHLLHYHLISAPQLPLMHHNFKHTIFQHHFITTFPAHDHCIISTSKPPLHHYFNITAPPAPPEHHYFINMVRPAPPIHHHFTVITTPSPPPLHSIFTVTSLLSPAGAN